MDRYYPDNKYTFPPWKEMKYIHLVKFVYQQFLLRNLPEFTNKVLTASYTFQIPLMIYVRDVTEPERDWIDFNYYQAYLQYTQAITNAADSKSNFQDIIFATGDVKEGFGKEFFDGMNLFDKDLPFLMILDNTLDK
eukprot:CAMPEP_0170557704 /NCGR_PEP_ID=MMETSP0211-20121228/29367_1 /TAXON_ID=311385 /ORGANISM="Pseudokeronopsis sp., Strain OXSARD2" /LENGTH=135 /DNA_ID=CAMNT_0010868955 /DNA_START=230 /DNA_END=637 /DNA_ORIENTATION=-